MTSHTETPSPAEITAYLTRQAKFEAEMGKLAWLAVCELEAGDVSRARKTAAACTKVQQEALADTRRVYGPNG